MDGAVCCAGFSRIRTIPPKGGTTNGVIKLGYEKREANTLPRWLP